MPEAIKENFRIRKDYGEIDRVGEIPNLIEVQRQSYEEFLQANVDPDEREDRGLRAVFKSVFPIRDFNETSTLEFVNYHLGKPKYDIDECAARGMTYAAPVKVTIRLVVWDVDEDTDMRSIRDVKEKEVFFGEIPLMTPQGTFIINGTERVIVNQLHRSPGAFFDHDEGKKHSSDKLLYSARIIPYRGSWLDLEFNSKDIIHVRIDRKRKMPATVLLRALGYSEQQLLDIYYDKETIKLRDGEYFKEVNTEVLRGQEASVPVEDDEGNTLVEAGKKYTRRKIHKLAKKDITEVPIAFTQLVGQVAAHDIFDPETGEVIVECNEKLTEEAIKELEERDLTEFDILFIDNVEAGPYLRDTLETDSIATTEEAKLEIYKRLRPGDPPTEEQAEELFENLFFNPERYDLSNVGRLKLNHKFHHDTVGPLEERERKLEKQIDQTEDSEKRQKLEDELVEVREKLEPWRIQTLREEDILQCVHHLIELRNGHGQVDDIDHLGNRRVRTVGELLENQYRIGLVRMERGIKERMSMSQEIETLMPDDLINAKPVSAVLKEYFGSSQLSQFMDQTNPLSELAHKRRLSALGPGGLTRERAGFDVRDVHVTHYGRICPIETPEGPNIGLITALATYARVNEYGFVETPYRTVEDGVATDEVRYYSALEEEGHTIAQANAKLNDDGTFVEDTVAAREDGEPVIVPAEEVDLMDVDPNQLVSVGAGLIPFLENDDANRALMGANMQRQGVPLVESDAPFVGTGIERTVATDSEITIVAENAGVVESVDSERIVVRPETDEGELFVKPDIYNLQKYKRSNQGSCFNQTPVISQGDWVEEGEILADGPSTERGELALGRNVTVAFMPWGGYNFEDAILISERLVKEDVYTSIHIEEYECTARDTKLGKEEITRDIPNVGEDALKDLDESGIIRIGAEVEPGDIIVGKVTPKGETQLSPEEKLLRAIFGEKAGDVKNSSKKMPPGDKGTVIDAKVFYRQGAEKDLRTEEIEDSEEAKLLKDQNDEIRILRDAAYKNMRDYLRGKEVRDDLVDESDTVLIEEGSTITDEILDDVPRRYWTDIAVGEETQEKLMEILGDVEDQILNIRMNYGEKIEKLRQGDELPPGVIKMVKVYVAKKSKIEQGDKLAGRHGNKGVISKILPEEDLPFMKDGTTVDMILNPLGVPSRMNVGQVLETHLGWAAKGLAKKIQYMLDDVSDADTEDIRGFMKEIYEKEDKQKMLEDLDEDQVEKVAERVTETGGIHISSRVFDGAPESQIRDLIEKADLHRSGKTTLFDGRTGEPFDNDVTVGVMYVLKLHHLVDDKIHARSIGPYSLVTQQPLGGKAQFGGQRLGEMEVWAIEAYGAANTLQEFLTVKSDDVQGRTRIYESIVKGDFSLNPGMPESFNVLIKELHSLCLNVELLEDVA